MGARGFARPKTILSLTGFPRHNLRLEFVMLHMQPWQLHVVLGLVAKDAHIFADDGCGETWSWQSPVGRGDFLGGNIVSSS